MYIFDGCVAIKWLVEEDDSAAARRLLELGQPRIGPDLVVAEMVNAIWKHVARNGKPKAEARAACAAAPGFFRTLVPIIQLMPRATDIMIELVHPIYDCIYLALAERESLPLVTVDQRLIDIAKRLPSVEVVHLRDL